MGNTGMGLEVTNCSVRHRSIMQDGGEKKGETNAIQNALSIINGKPGGLSLSQPRCLEALVRKRP
jgi:hypothetical protein